MKSTNMIVRAVGIGTSVSTATDSPDGRGDGSPTDGTDKHKSQAASAAAMHRSCSFSMHRCSMPVKCRMHAQRGAFYTERHDSPL